MCFFFLPIFWEIVTAETANSLNRIYTHLTTHLVERATSFNVVAIFQHIAKSRYDSDSIYIDWNLAPLSQIFSAASMRKNQLGKLRGRRNWRLVCGTVRHLNERALPCVPAWPLSFFLSCSPSELCSNSTCYLPVWVPSNICLQCSIHKLGDFFSRVGWCEADLL